jgi:spermidine synthase
MILAVAFVAGLCTLIIELAGSRLLAPYLGNSIYTWSAVIGVVFAGSSAGYYLGSRSIRDLLSENSLKASICILLSIPLFALVSPFFNFMPPGISHISGALVLALPSFFLGMIVTNAIASRSRKIGIEEATGEVFAISTLGSLAGALLAGFVLIPNIPIAHIFILSAFLMLITSWLAGKFEIIEIVPFGFLAAVSIFSLPVPFHDTEILFQEQSPYQLVTVSRAEYNGHNTTAMILDRLVESWEYDNGTMVYDYFERGKLAYQILESAPQSALIIGLGAGSQVKELREDFPGIRVNGIEIDPKVVEAGKEYFSLVDDEQTDIIIGDGRRGLLELDKTYDIVLMDVFKGQSMPNHMVSREFFGEVKSKMNDGGILVINIASNTNGTNSEFFRNLHATLETQFAEVAAIPQNKSGEKFERQTIIIIATDADMSAFRDSNREVIYEPGEGKVFTDDWSPADILNPV